MDEIAQITAENRRLRRQIARYRVVARWRRRASVAALDFARRVFFGRRLDAAIAEAVAAIRRNPSTFPVDEVGELFAALVYRFVRVGAILCLLALAPTALLVWQNIVMVQQNALIRTQNEFFRDQNGFIREQVVTASDSRRVQLVELLYRSQRILGDDLEYTDGPFYDVRTRREALSAFISIELANSQQVDLRLARLDDVTAEHLRLFGASLDRVSLRRAKLTDAIFNRSSMTAAAMERAVFVDCTFSRVLLRSSECRGTVFENCLLDTVDLTWSRFTGAVTNGRLANSSFEYAMVEDAVFESLVCEGVRFVSANMRRASFTNCTLIGVDFSGADMYAVRFAQVRLVGVDFRKAGGVHASSFVGVSCDRTTVWPEAFKPEAHGIQCQ